MLAAWIRAVTACHGTVEHVLVSHRLSESEKSVVAKIYDLTKIVLSGFMLGLLGHRGFVAILDTLQVCTASFRSHQLRIYFEHQRRCAHGLYPFGVRFCTVEFVHDFAGVESLEGNHDGYGMLLIRDTATYSRCCEFGQSAAFEVARLIGFSSARNGILWCRQLIDASGIRALEPLLCSMRHDMNRFELVCFG